MNRRLSTVLVSVFGAATVLTACWAPGAGRYAPIPDRTRTENVGPTPEDSSPCTEPLGCTPPPVYTPPVDDHRPPAGPEQPEPEADRRVEPPAQPCDPCTAPPPVPPGPRPLVAVIDGPAGVLDPAGQAPHGSDERFVPPTPAGQAPSADPDPQGYCQPGADLWPVCGGRP